MLATAPRSRRKALVGTPRPRVGPPTPARASVKAFSDRATELGLTLFPWQQTAARYLTAEDADGHPLYREVAIIVARQNGKTRLLLPLVVQALLAGKRVMHAAQTLRLPGEFHRELAELFERKYPMQLPLKRGISWRAGQENIRTVNGGLYQIVAATGGAPRGPSNQLVIVDEIREMEDDRFIAGIKPTMIAQPDAQIVYLSNAGTEDSVVLNALRARAAGDQRLAYLEWSAAPDRKPDDIAGWLDANPAIGHNPVLLENLEDEYRAALLGGTMARFETEHLCRWVTSMDERLISDEEWRAQEFGEVDSPTRSYMAVKMDIAGERASAVVAWPMTDGRIALDVHDTRGPLVDVARLGADMSAIARNARAPEIAFDPYTDADLVRYFRKSKPINGREYAIATAKFVRLVRERRLVVHDPAGILAADLEWTTKKPAAFDSFMAVQANAEHPNTAAVAAIRAAWLASAPQPTSPARIW